MQHKIALVTGASGGMGRETALALAKKGFFVVMLCRNLQRGEEAASAISRAVGRPCAEVLRCDLGSMQDVFAACEAFTARYGRLDVLVCNAGVLNIRRKVTHDGLEEHFGVCHMGHFLLANLLIPCMQQGARIVVVSSVAHKWGSIRFDDMAMQSGYSVYAAYGRAKLCNMLFALSLSKKLLYRGIYVNAVHPGAVITEIGKRRKGSKPGIGVLRRTLGLLLSPFVKTAKQGAETAVYVATSPACDGITGQYFVNSRAKQPSAKAKDEALAKALWQYSEAITGFTWEVTEKESEQVPITSNA